MRQLLQKKICEALMAQYSAVQMLFEGLLDFQCNKPIFNYSSLAISTSSFHKIATMSISQFLAKDILYLNIP